jgi:hypothetical protein
MAQKRGGRRRRQRGGRPTGSSVPIERDKHKHEVAVCHALRMLHIGPYIGAYWAVWVTSHEPIKAEDVEGLLTAAGTKINFTASSREKHIDALARKVDRTPVESSEWLHMSALAIKAAILAARIGDTELYCNMVDVLI